MPTTTAKRGPGRPATKKAPVQKKTPIKRKIKEYSAKEYVTLGSVGATYLMQQKGITIYDEDLEIVREIRYCPSEQSIYRDEQSEIARRQSVVFNDGRLFVRKNQPNLMSFMDAHPGNVANGGNLFKEVDKEANAKIRVDDEFLAADAISMVRDKPIDDLLAVAISMSIDIDRPVSEIKYDLLVSAKKNPSKFISSFDDPVVSMKSKVKLAEKYQVIKISSKGISWFDTGNHILSVPDGKDPVDVFVRYCMTEAATNVVNEIDKQLNT